MGDMKKVKIEIYCPACKGEGILPVGVSPQREQVPCPYCGGAGSREVGFIKLPKALVDG